MSIDAITYAKTLDVDNPMSRLLLFIIAENTFNDSGLCRVGQQVLAHDCRASERTVRTHLKKLDKATAIAIKAQPLPGGGRAPDTIELVGFLDWLRAVRGKPEPAKFAGSKGGPNRQNRDTRTGKQVAGSNKNRTSRSVQDGNSPPTHQPAARSAKNGFQKTDDALGEDGKLLIPLDHVVDLKADTSAKRLPFTPKTIAEVRMLCVDPAELIERYHAEVAKGLECRNPNGYLLRMARQAVERREGVSEAHVKAMVGKDHVKRAAFLAAEVEPAEPIGPVKVARMSAELLAKLRRGK